MDQTSDAATEENETAHTGRGQRVAYGTARANPKATRHEPRGRRLGEERPGPIERGEDARQASAQGARERGYNRGYINILVD